MKLLSSWCGNYIVECRNDGVLSRIGRVGWMMDVSVIAAAWAVTIAVRLLLARARS